MPEFTLSNRSTFDRAFLLDAARRLMPPDIGPRPVKLLIRDKPYGTLSGHMSMLTRKIRCDIGAASRFPVTDLRLGSGFGLLQSREEALLAVLAHEFRHMTQFCRGYLIVCREAEIDCDQYGAAVVAAYRDGFHTMPDPTLPPAPTATHLRRPDYAYTS